MPGPFPKLQNRPRRTLALLRAKMVLTMGSLYIIRVRKPGKCERRRVAGSRCNLRAVPVPAERRQRIEHRAAALEWRRIDAAGRGEGACGHGFATRCPPLLRSHAAAIMASPAPSRLASSRFRFARRTTLRHHASITKSTAYFNLQPAFPPELFAGSGSRCGLC